MPELCIKDYSLAQLRERLAEAGERPYRAEQIAAWLKDADRRYRAEEPDIKWPYFYSELILDELAPSGLSEVHPHT